MTGKGRFPSLIACVICLQKVINCIAYVAGVERGEEKGRIREREFSLFPSALFSPSPSRPFFAPATQAINCSECF